MRPVNLIPPEQRRGAQARLRTGPLPYMVLGALTLALIGVAVLVTTDNHISESKAEVAQLQRENRAAEAKAQRLAAYGQFRTLAEQRVATVESLADSRFDWERVMRELSKILPSNVWLTSLNASASPTAAEGGGGSSGSSASALRASIPGPALELSGCAEGQDGVAGFVTALKEVDGVTRVGVQSSAVAPEGSSAEGGGGGGGSGATDCRTRKFIAQFQMVVAFDAAPVPVSAETEAAAAEAAPEEEGSSSESSTSSEG